MGNETNLNAKAKKSLDLEDVFGFEAARKKAEDLKRKGLIEQNTVEPSFIPHRVFINDIDYYHGRNIAKFLSDQIFGQIKELRKEQVNEAFDEEEEEGAVDEDGVEKAPKETPKVETPPTETPTTETPKNNYEIVGTLRDTDYKLPEDIKQIIPYSKENDTFITEIMKCGFVIFDINTRLNQVKEATYTLKAMELEMTRLREQGPKAFKKMEEVRCFILISSVMTWALTKPIDPDEPGIPLTDTDYRKRKPHPNYKHHADLEKEVVKVGKMFKDKFKTLVVCSGITYGAEEDTLGFLFRQAWLNEPELPLFLAGKNKIPMINIQDLATMIHTFLEEFPPSGKYILAIEMHVNKLKTIVKAISKALSTGRYKQVTKEEAFMIPKVTQRVYDKLTVDLNMEPSYIGSSVEINWASETSFAENIQKIVTEYKDAHGLKALKIYVHGPPASGKTLLAKRLCQHYKLHYLNVPEIINEALLRMTERIQLLKAKDLAAAAVEDAEQEEKEVEDEADEAEEEEEEEEEEKESVEDVEEQLAEIQRNMILNEGRLDEQYVLRILSERLGSNPCQNQGYVLDKYPKTIVQAKGVFDNPQELEDEEEAGGEAEEGAADPTQTFNKKTVPEFVISLEAKDEVILERVAMIEEVEANGSQYSEQAILARLKSYRTRNNENNTVLQFFDEIEIHPVTIPVDADKTPDMESTFQTILKIIGDPKNFGPTRPEIALMKKAELERLKIEEVENKKKEEALMKTLEEIHHKNMEEWVRVWEVLKKEEEEHLALQSIPLRTYLIRYVFPTLIKGLKEIERVRPSDPVDYLAEFLFRENPEGKMMQPDYTAVAEDLMSAINRLQGSIQDIGSLHLLNECSKSGC